MQPNIEVMAKLTLFLWLICTNLARMIQRWLHAIGPERPRFDGDTGARLRVSGNEEAKETSNVIASQKTRSMIRHGTSQH